MTHLWILFVPFIVLAAATIGYRIGRRRQHRIGAITQISIDSVPHFASLTTSAQDQLRSLVTTMAVPEGTWIIKEHEVDNNLFYVISGRVNILKSGQDYETYLNSIGPGEFFGEIAFLTGSERLASVRAIENSELISFRAADFEKITQIAPQLKATVWAACELHTISLTMSDHGDLRSIHGISRNDWIALRLSLGWQEDPWQVPEGYRWLAVVAGEVVVRGKIYKAPYMTHVSAGSEITPHQRAYICLLPSPNSQMASVAASS